MYEEKSRDELIGTIAKLNDRVLELEKKRSAEKKPGNSGRVSDDRYRLIHSPTVNLVLGIDGKIHEISKLSADQLGYSEDELIDRNIRDYVIPEHRDRISAQLGRDFKGDYIPGIEIDVTGKDGAVHTLLFSPGQEVLFEEYKPSKILFTGIDITDRKLAEEELRIYTEHLEEEVRKRTSELIQVEKMAAIGQLVAGVAHEINNPLAFIKSKTERIKEDAEKYGPDCRDDTIRGFLVELAEEMDTNLNGINRIARITNTLKRYARPDIEGTNLANINEGLKYSLEMMQNQFRHRIRVHEDFGKIPKTECNIGQLDQVFLNFLLNASESMETGEVWVKTWHDEQNIYIQIKDNGRGIREEVLNRIFDPFYTTKESGTGLGLSISFRIIKDHDGEIKVRSEVRKGTTMTIELPIKQS